MTVMDLLVVVFFVVLVGAVLTSVIRAANKKRRVSILEQPDEEPFDDGEHAFGGPRLDGRPIPPDDMIK
jgi:uncharacterized membrane protein